MYKKYQHDPTLMNLYGPCAIMRGRVWELVREKDWIQAIEVSRQIPVPWYRAQAIAHIAGRIPDLAEADRLLRDGLDIAFQGEDTYRQVAVCAWLIAAAAERGLIECAAYLIQRVQPRIHAIEPAVSRAWALDKLWQSCVSLGPQSYEPLVWQLADACSALQRIPERSPRGKGRSQMAALCCTLWNVNRELAERVLSANVEPDHAARLRARITAGQTYVTFFARSSQGTP